MYPDAEALSAVGIPGYMSNCCYCYNDNRFLKEETMDEVKAFFYVRIHFANGLNLFLVIFREKSYSMVY